MKKLLQFVSVGIIAVALVLWLKSGANAGWTKTSVPVKTLDEVTGIEGITYQKRFVPGVDFLGAAFAGALVLAGVSFFINKHKPTKINP